MTAAEALLAQMRLRAAELRQTTFAIDEVGIMLAGGHISPQGALYWLWANGVDLDDIVDLSACEVEDAA